MLSDESKKLLHDVFSKSSSDNVKIECYTTEDTFDIEIQAVVSKGLTIDQFLIFRKDITKEDYETNPLLKELFRDISYEEFIDAISQK